jgi:DNA-binding NtrC family response regulator
MQVFQVMHKVCASDSKVMILGETGTGKELVAQAIHAGSRRSKHQFAVLNCDNKAQDLVAAELFGSLRGSFTGSTEDRIGLFAFADHGTVFLDEVGDLNPDTQLRLLRVLETGVYQKIGSPEDFRADIRVLCATHCNLEQMVREKTFREDLYYRLKGVTVQLPPLRERKEDIQPLVQKFSARFTVEQGLPPKLFDVGAIDEMVRHDWPGNVRELLEAVEALIVLCDSEIIFGADVCRYLKRGHPVENDPDMSLVARVRSYERVLILEALAATGYNIAAAAKLLEMDRSNLAKKIRALRIPIPDPDRS